MNSLRRKAAGERPNRTASPTSWLMGIATLLAVVATVGADDSLPAANVVVEPVRADMGALPLELAGSFIAKNRSLISSELPGLVQRIDIEVGDEVTSGDVLFALDDTLAKLALQSAQAAAREAGARAEDAERKAKDNQSLRDSGAVSTTVIETSQASARVAQAALASQKATVSEQAERVARHQVRAPFGGVIANRMVAVGEWITAGTPALELVANDNVWFEVNFPQGQFSALNDATPIEVESDASPGSRWTGKLAAAVPVGDAQSRTMRVRISVDDENADLISGSSGVARFALDNSTGVVRVSRDALTRRPDGSTGVWVVRDDGDGLRAYAQRVVTGRSVGEAVEVRDGLAVGDRVVVRGNESLTQRQSVQLVSITGEAAQ